MLGAYGAYFLNVFGGFNPLLSAVVDGALGIFVGYAFYFSFLHRELRGKERITLRSEMVTLVSTFGLSLFMSNLAVVAFTGDFVGINWSPGTVALGFLELPLGALYVTILAVLIISTSVVFLDRTYIGNAIKAYSQDITATQLVGAAEPSTPAVCGRRPAACAAWPGPGACPGRMPRRVPSFGRSSLAGHRRTSRAHRRSGPCRGSSSSEVRERCSALSWEGSPSGW